MITTGIAPLKSQIANAFKMDRMAKPDLVALLIDTAISSIAPMGLFPPGPTPAPLAPAGFAATKTQLTNSLKLDRMANVDLVALQMAQSISVLCPTAPPIGLIALKSQIANAFKMDRMAKPDLVAQLISSAIVTYYTTGGVI